MAQATWPLSLDANLSTKHLSFVETGRSSPSRQLLVHLAQQLDLPIAEGNRLLLDTDRPHGQRLRYQEACADDVC